MEDLAPLQVSRHVCGNLHPLWSPTGPCYCLCDARQDWQPGVPGGQRGAGSWTQGFHCHDKPLPAGSVSTKRLGHEQVPGGGSGRGGAGLERAPAGRGRDGQRGHGRATMLVAAVLRAAHSEVHLFTAPIHTPQSDCWEALITGCHQGDRGGRNEGLAGCAPPQGAVPVDSRAREIPATPSRPETRHHGVGAGLAEPWEQEWAPKPPSQGLSSPARKKPGAPAPPRSQGPAEPERGPGGHGHSSHVMLACGADHLAGGRAARPGVIWRTGRPAGASGRALPPPCPSPYLRLNHLAFLLCMSTTVRYNKFFMLRGS